MPELEGQATPATGEKPRATLRERFQSQLDSVRQAPADASPATPSEDGSVSTGDKAEEKPRKAEGKPDAKPDAPPEAKPGEKAEPSKDEVEALLVPNPQDSPELAKQKKDLLKGFTQGRQRDSQRASAAETKAQEFAKKLEAVESMISSWNPVFEKYQKDAQFREKFHAIVEGNADVQTDKSADRPRSPRLQKYLDTMEPKAREATLEFIDLVRGESSEEIKSRDEKIRELREKLGEVESSVRRETDVRMTQSSAQQQQEFIKTCPQFLEISTTQQQAFIAYATGIVRSNPNANPIELFKEFHGDLQGQADKHHQAELDRLRAQTGKTPPAGSGMAGESVPQFNAKNPRGAFYHYLGKRPPE